MIYNLLRIIRVYERVILERLTKGFDSKINQHGEKNCLLEASEELQARFDTSICYTVNSQETVREPRLVEDLFRIILKTIENRDLWRVGQGIFGGGGRRRWHDD